ncbi:MAG: alginate export family protein [Planctomycetales bacterium]|nr:alginate export family protein [Planctomycetales bacterium]
MANYSLNTRFELRVFRLMLGTACVAVLALTQTVSAANPTEQAVVSEVSYGQPVEANCIQQIGYQEACPECQDDTLKKKREALTAEMKDAYKGVFYANKFSYLNDPLYDGPLFIGDSFKGMLDGKLDIGGEYRSRYHHENNHRGLGLTGVDDQFWLTRGRLYANYRMTDDIRFYTEYLYADSAGESVTPRPIEENRGEMQNLFVDALLFDTGTAKMLARVGRQELLLGNQRLVSPLDWGNTRRTFDGYRATLSTKNNDLDLFYTNPVNRVAATSGANAWDSSNNNQSFYGAYLSNKTLGETALEAYYLGYDHNDQNFSFHTVGSRLAGKCDELLYELEGGLQFGDNVDGSSHSAGFVTGGLGRKLNLKLAGGKTWNPTVWGWYDWASGGNSILAAPGDDSFHHYFPLAHKYNGFMDLFGRRNLNDVNFQFMTPLGSKVNFLLWYHYFFLDKATTPYSVVMTPYNSGTAAVSKDLGHEIDLLWTVNIDARQNVLVGYSHFHAGDYYETPNVQFDGNADFFYTQYQVRF